MDTVRSGHSLTLFRLLSLLFGFSIPLIVFSDLSRYRFLFALSSICIAIAGVVVLLKTHHNEHLEYGVLFLVAMGALSAMPVVICWFTMNSRATMRVE